MPNGEKELHYAPRSGMKVHTKAVCLYEPRIFLRDLGSLELFDRAEGWKRRVHVILPLPVSVGPLARPQAQGQGP